MEHSIPKRSVCARPRGSGRGDRAPWLTEFVYVVDLKRFIHTRTGVMLDKEQFTDTFGYVTLEQDRVVPASAHFLHGGGGRKLQRVTFRPGAGPFVALDNGVLALNTYRPPIVQPTHGSVQPWLDLGEHVLPDPAVRQHHLQYCAHLFQHPDTKINHALLLISLIQGVGKDSSFAPIMRSL